MRILLEILIVALVALAVARFARPPWRGRLLNALKGYVTVRAFWLLLTHPVKLDDGTREMAWSVIVDQLARIELAPFLLFVGLAAAIKFGGILSSMYRWTLLLRGQGIDLPFRHIFGSFLIGRFIGTFLPSTAGLDGYKLYDAARFSGRTVEVTAATALEKVLGVSGIFLSFLVALPFGIQIFGDRAATVASITVPISLGVIAGLLVLLWYPALIQWGLDHLPLPGRARLEGLVMRVSRAAAAYRDKRGLVLTAVFLSFLVHFTTAAMYYFTALAIGAENAHFWPIAFGSSIQIFATVVSPFTIAGEGIREAAQFVLLGHWIGPGAAIVSAALGFWAAEALTLLGGFFWWLRGPDYRPAYCRVDGVQVDYQRAARAALELGARPEDPVRTRPPSEVPPLGQRLRLGAGVGFGAGCVSGLLLGGAEAAVIASGALGSEAQVLWYGPLAYALVLAPLAAVGGAVLAALPLEERELRGWIPSLAMLALLVPFGLAITLFRVRRDVFHEQMPPMPVLLGILGVAAVIALALFFFGPRLFAARPGRVVRALPALGLAGLVALGGAVAARALVPPAEPPGRAAAAGALAERPNLILVMVDTLRADVLSCYGGSVEAPHLCSLGADSEGGTRYPGFAHASWTKPSTATLLTSLLPSSHGAVTKTDVLSEEVELVSEVLRERGYSTGGIVSNINLTESFGFAQGWDEYHYLAPDYLFGAEESSSKLVLYQIARKVWFKLKPGLRVGDFYQDAATVNRVAFDWLERHRDSRFFLFLHYMDPHDPYFAHPYDGTAIARVENEHPDPARADEMRRLYEGEVAWLDERVGKLLAKLRELGVYENALIVLTSDHGEEFHEHGGWWHGKTLYEEQIHVPLLVKWPRGERPASAPRLARLIDIAPTLIARGGAALPEPMQGVPLDRSSEGLAERHGIVYAEENHEGNVLEAVRTPEWKLIHANPGNPRGLAPVELFDVARDPGETRNLHDRRSEMARRLTEWMEAERRLAQSIAVGSSETAQLTREECERLRVLGYVTSCEDAN